ncbi:MAG: NAD(P)H-binding protein [Anaerolineales bacterium]|nr:NAD(P)H-binding protein [Anaerolineales bacterium]
MDKRILVTGASGYIAGKLIPRLLEGGYPVRCMARTQASIANRPWTGQVEVVEADVTDPASLPAALKDIDSAYYLIHNMARGRDYQQAELNGARNFSQAAYEVGVEQIIYLGGLANPKEKIAPHLRSRIETGRALREFPVPVTEFRAGVIAGPGSISFEMIRFISEQLPLLVGPVWLRNRSQPISAGNVLDYLIAALENSASRGLTLEIGGPEVFYYDELMSLYAKVRGLNRRIVLIPGLPVELMAYFVDKLTPVPEAIAYPLINGLQSDSLVKDPKAISIFPKIELTPYRQAVSDALAQLDPSQLDRIWVNGAVDARLKHEGLLIESRHCPSNHDIDALVALASEKLPDYEVISSGNDHLHLRALFRKNRQCWLEWELLADEGVLRQTGLLAPKGLLGFLASRVDQAAHRRLFREISKTRKLPP